MKQWLYGVIVLILVAVPTVNVDAVELTVMARYVDRQGGTFERVWQVAVDPETVTIFREGDPRCRLVVGKQGISRIILMKRHQGVSREMTLTDPVQIQHELETGFYPYVVILDYLAGKERKDGIWEQGTSRFQIVGVTGNE